VDPSYRSTPRRLVLAFLKRFASTLIPIGYSLGEFTLDAKTAFVEAAADHIKRRGDRPSDARIAILTGLSRAEVSKIRSLKNSTMPVVNTQRAERVMHGWFTDERFVDTSGVPKLLPIHGQNSFAFLVREYSGDIPYRALLNELVAGGMAKKTQSRSVQAIRRHYMKSAPEPNSELELLSIDAAVLLDSNVNGRPSSIRRLAVDFSSSLPPSILRNINVRIERFLDALSDYLHMSAEKHEKKDGDIDAQDTSFRIMIAHRELPKQNQSSVRETHDS
jgi:hypothetical protein